MRLLSAVVLVPLAVLTACSSPDTNETTTVTVFAAASLVDAFGELGDAFTADNPDIRIDFNFASSSDLATQILEGAPADVFASADTVNIDKVRQSSVPLGDPRTFATNSLQILVETGNPKNIATLADLADPDLVYITCDEAVPIGRYSAQILAQAGVIVTPTSYEENVKGIVNKIVLGEADAGIVYRTDVIAAGSAAQGIAIPDAFNVRAAYPIVTVGDEPSASSRSFVDFVSTSPTARAILSRYGFGPP